MMKKITCGSKVGSLPNGPYIYICSQSYSTKLATKFCDLPFFAVAKFSHLNANSGKSNSSACKWLYGCYASVQDVTFLLYTQSHQTYIFPYNSVYMRYAHFPPYAHFTPHYPMPCLSETVGRADPRPSIRSCFWLALKVLLVCGW